MSLYGVPRHRQMIETMKSRLAAGISAQRREDEGTRSPVHQRTQINEPVGWLCSDRVAFHFGPWTTASLALTLWILAFLSMASMSTSESRAWGLAAGLAVWMLGFFGIVIEAQTQCMRRCGKAESRGVLTPVERQEVVKDKSISPICSSHMIVPTCVFLLLVVGAALAHLTSTDLTRAAFVSGLFGFAAWIVAHCGFFVVYACYQQRSSPLLLGIAQRAAGRAQAYYRKPMEPIEVDRKHDVNSRFELGQPQTQLVVDGH